MHAQRLGIDSDDAGDGQFGNTLSHHGYAPDGLGVVVKPEPGFHGRLDNINAQSTLSSWNFAPPKSLVSGFR